MIIFVTARYVLIHALSFSWFFLPLPYPFRSFVFDSDEARHASGSMDPELMADLRAEHFKLGYGKPASAAETAYTYETNEKTRQRVVAEATRARRRSILLAEEARINAQAAAAAAASGMQAGPESGGGGGAEDEQQLMQLQQGSQLSTLGSGTIGAGEPQLPRSQHHHHHQLPPPKVTVDPDLLIMRRERARAAELKQCLQKTSYVLGDDPLYF
jgi:hypothetical protein